jgi:tRNA wybutosine-synthesizing protein 1
MEVTVEDWWITLRLPLAAIAVAIWIFLVRRRKVESTHKHPENVKAEIITPEPQPEIPADTRKAVELKHTPKSKPKKSPKTFTRTITEEDPVVPLKDVSTTMTVHIFYASQFNHTSTLAKQLYTLVLENAYLHDISVIPNLDDYFLQHPSNAFYFLLVPSYANDSGPTQVLIEALDETLNDFRVDANPLRKLTGFAVFGTGDREGWPLKKEFCYQAVKVEKLMERLGARRVFNMGMGDTKGRISLESQMAGWAKRVLMAIKNPAPEPQTSEIAPTPEDEEEGYDSAEEELETPLLDVEDMGPVAQRHKSASTDFTAKPMVSKTSTTYSALTKQGYTIVGTHSGVKICRWTKSALRGRGSCYKFSFYGIKSHLCMETTPSLACANKCVFCWRHGTNPVGTTWRWQVDPPEVVYKGALEGHYTKINMLKGMLGVKPARYEEAKRVRHCALSLVGEPIFCTHTSKTRRKVTNNRSTY